MANSKKKNSAAKVIEIPLVTPQVTPPVESFIEQVAEWYPIDYNKVKTIEDIKLILSKMSLGVMSNVPDFEELKHILSDKPAKQ
jgi:hypothetical protein